MDKEKPRGTKGAARRFQKHITTAYELRGLGLDGLSSFDYFELLLGIDRDAGPLASLSLVANDPVHPGKDRMVTADADVVSRVDLGSHLPNQYIAREHSFAGEDLYASPLTR
jgi:hypothetical protein